MYRERDTRQMLMTLQVELENSLYTSRSVVKLGIVYLIPAATVRLLIGLHPGGVDESSRQPASTCAM